MNESIINLTPGLIIERFENKHGLAELWLAITRDRPGDVPDNVKQALRVYFRSCLNHIEETAE
jgi:hypothetical protein